MEKTCRTCGEVKPVSEFYKRKDSPDGYRNDCAVCRKQVSMSNYFANHEAKKAENKEAYARRMAANPNWHKDHYATNREKMLAEAKKQYRKNRKVRIASAVAWAKANRGMANANKKAYKASKIQACPAWVKQDEELKWIMQEAYELAALRSEMFGFQWHVDHVVPLRGKKVCGLHVPWNLQVIPGSDNCSKSNKYSME